MNAELGGVADVAEVWGEDFVLADQSLIHVVNCVAMSYCEDARAEGVSDFVGLCDCEDFRRLEASRLQVLG